jgi:hypothetical protein
MSIAYEIGNKFYMLLHSHYSFNKNDEDRSWLIVAGEIRVNELITYTLLTDDEERDIYLGELPKYHSRILSLMPDGSYLHYDVDNITVREDKTTLISARKISTHRTINEFFDSLGFPSPL